LVIHSAQCPLVIHSAQCPLVIHSAQCPLVIAPYDYDVKTRVLVHAVKRDLERFPKVFMFHITTVRLTHVETFATH